MSKCKKIIMQEGMQSSGMNDFLKNTSGYARSGWIILGVVLGMVVEAVLIIYINRRLIVPYHIQLSEIQILLLKNILLFFSVIMAGAFGGLLYALRDKKKIELPCWETDTKNINVGSAADCAYGISGAFVVFLVIPGTFNLITPWDSIKVVATAMIGGYGGRAIVDKVLNEILKQRIEEVENKLEDKDKQIKEVENKLNEQPQKDAAALSLLSSQLDVGEFEIPVPEKDLKDAIKAASPTTKIQIFQKAEKVRRDNWNRKGRLMEKTIPVFEALIETDTENIFHRNHAQLGFIFKDKQKEPGSEKAEWEKAEEELRKAIKIRDQRGQKQDFLIYEFNHAICKIMIDDDFNKKKKSSPEIRESILMELREAAQIPHLATLIKTVDPIPAWLKLNNISQTL